MIVLPLLLASAFSGGVMVAHPEGPASLEDAWLADTVADELPRSIAAAGVPAVAREDRLAAQDELGLSTRSVTRATSIRVAEALGVSRLVVVRLATRNGEVSLSLDLVDLAGGTMSAPVLARGAVDDLLGLIHGLAWDVVLSGPSPPRVSRAAFDARRSYVPLRAWKPYAQALGATDSASRRRLLHQALGALPTFDAALLALGREELAAREDNTALATLGRVRGGGACSRSARFLRGVALLNLGRYREATELYATLVSEETTAASLNNRALSLLRQKGGVTEACALLRRSIDVEPGASDLAFNLGWCLLQAGIPDEAVFWLQGVVRRDVTDVHARVVLSWALRAGGRAPEADAEWAAASTGRTAASAGLATADLGRRFERIRRSDQLPALEGEGRSDSELAATHLMRADTLLTAGDAEAALAELLRATYLDPWSSRAQALLARALRKQSQITRAVSAYRMALWARNDNALRLELAQYLADVNLTLEAQAEARKVLSVEPDNAVARKLLGP